LLAQPEYNGTLLIAIDRRSVRPPFAVVIVRTCHRETLILALTLRP
jgi:hypothetical protein